MNLKDLTSSQIDPHYQPNIIDKRTHVNKNNDESENAGHACDSSHDFLMLNHPKVIPEDDKNSYLQAQRSLYLTRGESIFPNFANFKAQKSSELQPEDSNRTLRSKIFKKTNLMSESAISITPIGNGVARENTVNLAQDVLSRTFGPRDIIKNNQSHRRESNRRNIRENFEEQSNEPMANREIVINEMTRNTPVRSNLTLINQIQPISNPVQEDQSSNLNNQVTRETDPAFRQFYEPEVKIYLTKVIGSFLALFLFSLFLVLMSYSVVPYEIIFVVILIFLCYLILIDILWKKRVLGDLWADTDYLLDLFDISSFGFALVFFYLKFKDILPISSFACLPFLLTAIIHLSSESSFKGIGYKTFIRFFYGFSTLPITLKIDEALRLDWHFIFILHWIFLVIKSSYCFKYAFSLGKIILFNLTPLNLNQGRDSVAENGFRITGHFWFFMFHGLNIVAILVLLGVSQAYDSTNSFDLLIIFSFVSLVISIFLLFFTIFHRKKLQHFIIVFGLIESLLARHEESKKLMKRVKFILETKCNYFVMSSSTYFVPLHESFRMSKGNKAKLQSKRRIESSYSCVKGSVANILAMKESKQKLDKKFSKINEILQMNQSKIKHRQTKRFSISHIILDEQSELVNSQVVSQPTKRQAFSLNDLNQVNDTTSDNKVSSEHKEEDSLCYLCFSGQRDIILANCGHGGMCYECASAFIEKKEECVECRKKVEGFYRINPKPMFSNIVKAIEFHKVVISKS